MNNKIPAMERQIRITDAKTFRRLRIKAWIEMKKELKAGRAKRRKLEAASLIDPGTIRITK